MKDIILKFLVLIGKYTNWGFLPVCRVFNDKETEHYTLKYDGNVYIQGVNGGVTDMLPIGTVSERLQNKFIDKLETLIGERKEK